MMKRKLDNLFGIGGIRVISLRVFKKKLKLNKFDAIIYFENSSSLNTFFKCLPCYINAKKSDDCIIEIKGNAAFKLGKKRHDFVQEIFSNLEKKRRNIRKYFVDKHKGESSICITSFEVKKVKNNWNAVINQNQLLQYEA